MEMLMSKHPVSTILGVLSLIAAPVVLPHALTSSSAATALTMADTDKDGTLDKGEVDAAAGAEFDKLDKDKDGTLDKTEVGKRLSKADFAAADADHDKTLTKDEYLAVVDADFKATDADSNGTIEAKELHSKPGMQLEKLIK
jgi:Ca2+-binding EF-hand superfamily protein